jgi:hypothetical protein
VAPRIRRRLDRLAPVVALLLAASEPSKVPWYIAGGVLALWAVVLAWLGLSRPEFPYNLRGQRIVMGISLMLMIIAVAAAILTG